MAIKKIEMTILILRNYRFYYFFNDKKYTFINFYNFINYRAT